MMELNDLAISPAVVEGAIRKLMEEHSILKATADGPQSALGAMAVLILWQQMKIEELEEALATPAPPTER